MTRDGLLCGLFSAQSVRSSPVAEPTRFAISEAVTHRHDDAGNTGPGRRSTRQSGVAVQLVDSSTENRAGIVNTTHPDRHESGYPVWRVACGDMINRERSVAVYVDGGEVVVVGPPGEAARLTGSQLDELKTALGEAAKQAER